MTDLFDQMLDKACEAARSTMLKVGEHIPQFMLFTEQGIQVVLLQRMADDFDQRHKDAAQAVAIAKKQSGAQTLEAIIFCSEAWITTATADSDDNWTRPRDDPKRLEVLVIAGRDVAHNSELQCRVGEIIRVDNKPVEVAPLPMNGGVFDSPMIEAAERGWGVLNRPNFTSE